jgi:hypothetical protein
LLYEDFLRFVEALAARSDDPWELYQRHYLGPHRAVLEAWWEQCLGLPREAWEERVRAIRPENYGLLREVVGEADLAEMAREAMVRCQALLPLEPEPEVYYLVGFFSPDGFAFQLEGKWAIGIGMERLGSLRLVPVLLAHEYAHCYRRRRGAPRTLGERVVEEGFAVELAARAFPERPTAEHLLMRPGQVSALRQYETPLWEAVQPLLASEDEGLAARLIYGRVDRGDWPSRAGVYVGWRLVWEFLAKGAKGFDAPAEEVLRSIAACEH